MSRTSDITPSEPSTETFVCFTSIEKLLGLVGALENAITRQDDIVLSRLEDLPRSDSPAELLVEDEILADDIAPVRE